MSDDESPAISRDLAEICRNALSDALGAGGRRFKSCHPDYISLYFSKPYRFALTGTQSSYNFFYSDLVIRR